MESNLYKFEEEKTIELFQESDFLSTGDRSILKDDLTIALFEKNELFEDINKQKYEEKKSKKTKRPYDSAKEKERNRRRKEKFLAKSEEEKNIQRKRNAISAKKFRMKKKEEFNNLLKENEALREEIEFLKKKLLSLEDFISHYKLLSPKIYSGDLN